MTQDSSLEGVPGELSETEASALVLRVLSCYSQFVSLGPSSDVAIQLFRTLLRLLIFAKGTVIAEVGGRVVGALIAGSLSIAAPFVARDFALSAACVIFVVCGLHVVSLCGLRFFPCLPAG